MRMCIFPLICIHMLLWAGCQSTPGLHTIPPNENLLKIRVIGLPQINRSSWRKLLEENGAANPKRTVDEKGDSRVILEAKNADEKNGTLLDAKKDGFPVDAKKEEGKSDPAPLVAQKEEGKGDGADLRNNSNKAAQPKSDVNQEGSKEGKPKEDADERHTQVASTDEVSDEKDVIAIKEAPNVDAKDSNANPLEKDRSLIFPKSVEENLPIALTENDKHNSTTPQNTDETPDKTETSQQREPQDNQASKITDSEELGEVNPIKMVASTSSDMKDTDLGGSDKMALTIQPEGAGKEQTSHENALTVEEKADNPTNSTDGSNEVSSNTGDGKVEDEKVEEKKELDASLENKGDKREGGAETVLQEQRDEKVFEKQEVNDVDADKQSESNDTEGNEEKADETQESSQVIVEHKDDENEENATSVVAESDGETEAATKEVEMQLEALKRGTMIDTTVQQMQESDPSEDEYDIIHELADLPTKFQETAGKVADHLRPDVIKWKDTSKVYFNLANQQITKSFSPLIGKQYAPFIASMVSYGILLLPLIVVILLFDHIKALFSLQKVLLFINIYLAAYFATLWLASYIIGLEPMSFFYVNSLSSYLSLQLLQGLGYLVYLILQTANIFHACASDTLAGKVTSTLQWIVAMTIGLHYYVTVFHPAVKSKPPHTSWKFYAIYTAAFFVLCLFARIRWVKKQYVTSGRSIADKKS